jgi:hypothetical protein
VGIRPWRIRVVSSCRPCSSPQSVKRVSTAESATGSPMCRLLRSSSCVQVFPAGIISQPLMLVSRRSARHRSGMMISSATPATPRWPGSRARPISTGRCIPARRSGRGPLPVPRGPAGHSPDASQSRSICSNPQRTSGWVMRCNAAARLPVRPGRSPASRPACRPGLLSIDWSHVVQSDSQLTVARDIGRRCFPFL